MPRRKSVNFIRDIGVDPMYGSPLVQKLINVVMREGKKSTARTIVYDALEIVAKKCGGDKEKALSLFHRSIEQITPQIEVKARRVGGSMYQVPTEVTERRGLSLALRWLVSYAQERKDKTMGIRLGNEILEAQEGRGLAFKKKIDVHKMAEANRAFSHYSW
jgi:small subunit ribosomal protein S7